MALVKFSDGRQEMVKADEANAIWRILNGEDEPTEEQEGIVSVIQRVYLNWRNPETPDSYIEKNKSSIFPIIISRFMVDSDGKTARPEHGDLFLREFCDKWGITHFGVLTQAGRKYAHDR